MTAVEWLIDQLDIITRDTNKYDDFKWIFEYEIVQAKEMEKQQMCDFFREGYIWCNSPSLHIENGKVITSTVKYGELYYERKYGSKGSEETKQ